jgi:ABC-2 type transport system ATP-binding protein
MAAIQIDHVKKRFGTLQALGGVSLEIAEGEFFGLLGPNGAGKTTLISIIAGLSRADEGQVSIHGHDVVSDYRRARQCIGVVPQELVFDPFFTVRETLRMQSGYFGIRVQGRQQYALPVGWDEATCAGSAGFGTQAARHHAG